MRAHLSFPGRIPEAQSQETCSHAGGHYLHIRHTDNEGAPSDRYPAESIRYVLCLEAALNVTDAMLALCALSLNPENNFIAYPIRKQEQPSAGAPSHVPPTPTKGAETMSGDVMLFDANEMQEIKVIPAHQAPLSCMAMNSDGTLLATASEKGTVIRVFELPSAKKLYQFRRGSMPSRIYCMSFNATSTLLCVSSATETIHIFKLTPNAVGVNGGADGPPLSPLSDRGFDFRGRSESPGSMSENASTDLDSSTATTEATTPSAKPRSPGFMSLMRRTSQNVSSTFVSKAAGYLPSAVTEIWEPSRDFAWVKVPRSRSGQMVKSVVAMAGAMPQVMVATSEGEYLVYNVDLEKGGEGTLVQQYS